MHTMKGHQGISVQNGEYPLDSSWKWSNLFGFLNPNLQEKWRWERQRGEWGWEEKQVELESGNYYKSMRLFYSQIKKAWGYFCGKSSSRFQRLGFPPSTYDQVESEPWIEHRTKFQDVGRGTWTTRMKLYRLHVELKLLCNCMIRFSSLGPWWSRYTHLILGRYYKF